MHDLTHHIPCIMLFEDPQSYSTEVGELLNKKLVKEIYQAGNKHESPEFVSIFFFSFFFFGIWSTVNHNFFFFFCTSRFSKKVETFLVLNF